MLFAIEHFCHQAANGSFPSFFGGYLGYSGRAGPPTKSAVCVTPSGHYH
jgi:hypothetical protein